MGLLFVDEVKALGSLVKGINNIPVQEKVIELQSAALDAQEEIADLRQKVRELEERLTARERLRYKGRGAYYYVRDEGGEEGPICPKCYDTDGVVLPLDNADHGTMWCVTCKTRFNTWPR